MGFEEYDLYESDTPNYGKYERIDEGGLKRFDPKIIKIFNPREAILSKFPINGGVVENV
jgi:hypothetical protein